MSPELEISQRRKDKRIKQWNKARIQALAGKPSLTGQDGSEAYTYDLSLGGARIHSPRLFEVGTLVCLRIDLVRNHETVAIEGRVKWVRPSEADGVYEMGVEFEHSSSQTIMSLMKNLHDNKR
jgi:c-di-GMP-binding flagellar brake protein YcgR